MSLTIEENVILKDFTTLKVGGPARYFVRVKTVDELRAALSFAREQTTTPPFILGGGSNILVHDDGYSGVVIKNEIDGSTYQDVYNNNVTVTVGAGMEFDKLVAETVDKNLWGLENLSAIPGSVGATPVQNVGAYGVEVGNCILSVEALHMSTGEHRTIPASECGFRYRDSVFKTSAGRDWIITHVSFLLSTAPQPVLSYADLAALRDTNPTQVAIRETVIAVRSKKFPDWTKVGTAGSFFKNPIITRAEYQKIKERHTALPMYEVDDGHVKIPLGYVLDKICHLKGICFGLVCLYENQALVLIALRGATASDVDEAATAIAKQVFTETGIRIEREVSFV